MLDFGDIPRDKAVTSDVITSAGSWIAWNKPRGVAMIDILAVGAGGGGGGGGSPSSATNFGGTGGGAGSVASLIIPASYLPDVLYIFVGTGGAGGTATSNGSVGQNTIISTQPNNSTNSMVVLCYGGNGGVAGTNTVATVAPANTAAPTLYSLGYGGISTLSIGPGSNAHAAGVYAPTNRYYEDYLSLTCPGGAGAGGVNNKGAQILARQTFISPVIKDGYTLWKPLITVGGAGGNSSASTSTSGTAGGAGGFGSGGGGGGIGGTVSGTPGVGGPGGQGFVIIKSW